MKILFGEELTIELRRISDKIEKKLWIAVPYIGGMDSVRKIIGRNWIENPNVSIRLLSDTNEFNNFNSETIKLFSERGEIKHLRGVHAKIFIIDNCCLITSANLTNTAFSKRHEVGIFLDSVHSKKAIAIFESWWRKSESISRENLNFLFNHKFSSNEEKVGIGLPTIFNLPKDPGSPARNLEKRFLNYDSLLSQYFDFAKKYQSILRIWKTQPIFFEVDCFLNYLYHDAPRTPSRIYQSKKPRSLNSREQIKELKKYITGFKNFIDNSDIKRYILSSRIIRQNLNSKNIFSLSKAEIKEVFDRLNSLNSYPINKTRIFNNNSLKEIRIALNTLVNGEQLLAARMNECNKIKYLGSSSMNEILGFSFPKKYPLINKNSNSGLRFFGYNISAYK